MRLIIAAALGLALIAGPGLAQSPTSEQRAANFDKADTNKDGKLTREEFAATPRAQPPNDAVAVFEASDANHDGSVSKAEFIVPMAGEVSAPAPGPAPKATK